MMRVLIIVQAAYILLTAIWPLVHIESFMTVTGYKTDQWLVKTVGALLIPVGLTLLSFIKYKKDRRPAILLGAGTAIAFISIDFVYSLNDTISDVYQLDGVIEIIFLGSWIYILLSGGLKSSKN